MNISAPSAGLAEFWRNRALRLVVLGYALIWVITAVKPINRSDWLIENFLVFLALPTMAVLFRHRLLSDLSFVLLFSFLTLHAIGAHYTYTEMPLGNLFRDNLNWSRNHYDRVVHFAFGLLVAHPIREVLVGLGVHRRFLSGVLALHVVIAWSGLYEIGEGMVAHVVNPELGAAFNGIQGDIWDAQKDMSLALAGSLCAMVLSLGFEGNANRHVKSQETQIAD